MARVNRKSVAEVARSEQETKRAFRKHLFYLQGLINREPDATDARRKIVSSSPEIAASLFVYADDRQIGEMFAERYKKSPRYFEAAAAVSYELERREEFDENLGFLFPETYAQEELRQLTNRFETENPYQEFTCRQESDLDYLSRWAVSKEVAEEI